MTALNNAALLVARVLLSVMFIMSGFSKIGAYAGTQGYMDSMGVPGALLPLVIAVEIASAFSFWSASRPALRLWRSAASPCSPAISSIISPPIRCR